MATIDEEINGNFENDKQRLMANLIYTSNHFYNKYSNLVKPYGISMQQFNVLRILRGAKGELTVNVVKDRMIDKAPNLTRLSDKLVAKNLISRRRCDHDRRVVFLEISKDGLALLKEMDKDKGFEKAHTVDRLTDDEARIFNEVLDKLRD